MPLLIAGALESYQGLILLEPMGPPFMKYSSSLAELISGD